MTTARAHTHHERTILWGLLVSLLLHAVLFVPGVRDTFRSLDIKIESKAAALPMEFTLVSPPENPTPTNERSRFLSSVSSAARDIDGTETRSDLPHGDGRLPIPENASRSMGAGGGRSELPPLPEEQTGLTEALQRSRFTGDRSPAGDPSLPEETADFRHEGSARASIGGISLNTTAWDFAPYLLDLKQRVKQHWIPPIAFTALGAVHGYTWVRFRIHPDGHMEGLAVVETEGHDSLHRSSANAIKGSAPFRPLPKHFPEEYLEITFGFYYLLPGDEERYFKDGKFIRKEEGSQP